MWLLYAGYTGIVKVGELNINVLYLLLWPFLLGDERHAVHAMKCRHTNRKRYFVTENSNRQVN